MKRISLYTIGILITFLLWISPLTLFLDVKAEKKEKQREVYSNVGILGVIGISSLIEPRSFQGKGEEKIIFTLQKMESILEIDIRKELQRSKDPKKRLQEIESSLLDLKEEGKNIVLETDQYLQERKQERKEKIKEVKALEKQFSTELKNLEREEQQTFKKILQMKSSIVQIQEEEKRINRIHKRTETFLTQVRKRQISIIHNREVLLAGLQFDPKSSKGLGLEKSKETLEKEQEQLE